MSFSMFSIQDVVYLTILSSWIHNAFNQKTPEKKKNQKKKQSGKLAKFWYSRPHRGGSKKSFEQ